MTDKVIDRQPDKLDYASPTQFKFGIHQLPKSNTEYTPIEFNLSDVLFPIPHTSIPMMGDQLTYDQSCSILYS